MKSDVIRYSPILLCTIDPKYLDYTPCKSAIIIMVNQSVILGNSTISIQIHPLQETTSYLPRFLVQLRLSPDDTNGLLLALPSASFKYLAMPPLVSLLDFPSITDVNYFSGVLICFHPLHNSISIFHSPAIWTTHAKLTF